MTHPNKFGRITEKRLAETTYILFNSWNFQKWTAWCCKLLDFFINILNYVHRKQEMKMQERKEEMEVKILLSTVYKCRLNVESQGSTGFGTWL